MRPQAPLRYSVVAASCLLLHNVVLIGGSALGLGTTAAILASFVVVLTFGYLAHCLFTFRERPALGGLARYGMAMAANVPMTFLSIWLLNGVLRLPMTIAAPVSSIALVAVNFGLSRWAVATRAQPAEPMEKIR
ncbi:GtrA family protein [Novosphingobium sp.]|uniref:GtrA family protein n=1 Tax=Novosphingobium sp. TaxID=1874826 RepID=UPI002633C995|nr:GtrA family protein [Novosphingobium sp.]